jgi:AcrR family transcriptional regulator
VRADSPWRRSDGREQRSERTRGRIYEAALEEFRRVGFAAASISRITRRAGVSRPSFYFHFPTKEHVLLELQWELEHELVERISALADPVEAIHGFVNELVAAQERVGPGDLFRDLLQIWVRRPENVELEQHAMPAVQEVKRRFEQARAAGVLRPGVPAERAVLLFLTSVFGYLIGAGGDAAAERENLHALADLYLARP